MTSYIRINFRWKHHVRALFRTFALVSLIIIYATYSVVNNSRSSGSSLPSTTSASSTGSTRIIETTIAYELSSLPANDETNDIPLLPYQPLPTIQRLLSPSCDDMEVANPKWMLAFYIIGVLYMFLALAIVCDEFFVPSLEEMSSERYLNLSPDVAGATLMAAGGSAPELFTSLVGTFSESDIGFGTIVGSAVFNVLFVIAMCSFLAKEVLNLTWWPLFRDSTYYVISLGVLGLFVGYVGPGQVTWWESLILFAMYFGYVILMKYNRNLYSILTGKTYVDPTEEDEKETQQEEPVIIDSTESAAAAGARPSLTDSNFHKSMAAITAAAPRRTRANYTHGRWPGTFRAGIVKLLVEPESWNQKAGLGFVAQIAGDVDATFRYVDANGNGMIDKEELKMLFAELGTDMPEEDFEEAFKALDTNKDGMISEKEFTEYYIRSQGHLQSKMRDIFDKFDKNNSGTIDRSELKELLTMLEPSTTEEDIDTAMKEFHARRSTTTPAVEINVPEHGPIEDHEIPDNYIGDEITFDEFTVWYTKSILFEKGIEDVKAEMNGACDNLKPPKDGSLWQWVVYLVYLPLLAVLTATIPDVRIPGRAKYCFLSFILSILWIGVFSYFMVWWAEVIGNTLGIPSVVMGLTFIAAGTSVPDLLSSVIVARRGHGDMAVSSSLGSNVFDILVGLPLPWLIYSLVKQKPVAVGAEGVALSIFILLGMVIAVILTIHFGGWKLSKCVGFVMLILYGGFLAQAIYRELPFTTCQN